MKKVILILVFGVLLLTGFAASAHEAYVLDQHYFWTELNSPVNFHALDAWKTPHNITVTVEITIGVLVAFGLNFLFRRSAAGRRFHHWLEKLSVAGPIFIRAAIALAFFASAQSWSFLGPELSLHAMPQALLLRWILFAASLMIAVGFLTEFAALASLVAFTIGFFVFGAYLNTYLNYLGELIVLALFGMRTWSIDRLILGPKSWFDRWKRYDTVIVRIFYGVALMFAAITVKFLHPELTLTVIRTWHLTKFYWLFPSDPLLVALGAGLAELAIGFFILIGFQLRLTVFISLIYITLSLLFFRELVWPHLMLYGISLNLLVQPETFTVDRILFGK